MPDDDIDEAAEPQAGSPGDAPGEDGTPPLLEPAGLDEDEVPGAVAGEGGATLEGGVVEEKRPKGEGKGKGGKGKGGKGKSAKPKSAKPKAEGEWGESPPFRGLITPIEAPPPARRLPGGNAAAIVLAVVAVGAVIALVVTLLQLGNESSQVSSENALEAARTSAMSAAKTYSIELASYDYRQLTEDFGLVLSHSTPSFRKTFSQSSDALEPTLAKYHATAAAKVVAEGLVSSSTTQAVVLVFLDQTVTNSTQKAPTTDRSQIEITLVGTPGSWLINQVTLL
jgi:Mce-associated membrane protein